MKYGAGYGVGLSTSELFKDFGAESEETSPRMALSTALANNGVTAMQVRFGVSTIPAGTILLVTGEKP